MHDHNWWMVSIVLQSLALLGVIVVWFEGRKYESRQWRRIDAARKLYFQLQHRVELMGTVQAELVRKIEAAEAAAEGDDV
jgi:hypothetical protein